MNQQPMQNNSKINRVLYIVTVTLLFAIAVVIAVTTAANRKEKTPKDPEASDTVIETEFESEDTTAPITTDREKDAVTPPESDKKPQATETEASADETEQAEQVSAEPPKMNLPAVGILSKKHDTSLQVYSATMNDYRVHTGIDIITEEGAPVYAAANGTVSQVWDDPLMGKCLAISHSGDCYTVYKNLGEEIAEGIEAGVNVSAGQLIASVGNTAMIEIAEEPHLHFEITVGGEAADPLEFFEESALVSLTIDASYES